MTSYLLITKVRKSRIFFADPNSINWDVLIAHAVKDSSKRAFYIRVCECPFCGASDEYLNHPLFGDVIKCECCLLEIDPVEDMRIAFGRWKLDIDK